MRDLTEAQRRDCLAYDPFEGEDDGARTLADKFVRTRKVAVCQECAGNIPVGSEVRSMTEVCDGEIGTFRWCPECCAAMAASWEDGGESLEARVSLGMERRRALQETEGEQP